MNIYIVRTKDNRTYEEVIDPELGGPTYDYWPHGLFVAESAAQAKTDALYKWSRDLYLGVYSDDYPNLRARLIKRAVELPRGEIEKNDEHLWLRVHELYDHAGRKCDCPYIDALAEIAATREA